MKKYHESLPDKCIKPRIALTEDDFNALINGGIIETETVVISLKPMGYHRMQLSVVNAIHNNYVVPQQ